MNQCRNCTFWWPESEYEKEREKAFAAECRRHAPSFDPTKTYGAWPRVHATDGCGDHEPLEHVRTET